MTKSHWIPIALFLGACVGAAVRPSVFPPVQAAPAGQRCDWRYLRDVDSPELPKGMEQAAMSDEWRSMSEAGYRLVGTNNGMFYLFERCGG